MRGGVCIWVGECVRCEGINRLIRKVLSLAAWNGLLYSSSYVHVMVWDVLCAGWMHS
jgi:hypothetical protein